MNCENCNEQSENKLCPTCFKKSMDWIEDNQQCHNCDKPCAPCYDFIPDEYYASDERDVRALSTAEIELMPDPPCYDFDDDSTRLDNDLNETI